MLVRHLPTKGEAEGYYVIAAEAMLRNKGLAVLQKTYDDSYLSCSTAVYYEGQVRRFAHRHQPQANTSNSLAHGQIILGE